MKYAELREEHAKQRERGENHGKLELGAHIRSCTT